MFSEGRESGDVGREVRFRSAPWPLTVTAALERTPDAKHRRNVVVPEPQPRRQAHGTRSGWWVRRVSVNPPKIGLPVLGTDFRGPPESYSSATGFWISSNPNIYFFVSMVMDL